MNTQSKNKGFTFVELIIVVALALFLLGLSVPFVTALRSDIAMLRSLKQVKTDLLSTAAYALSGKSFAALAADDLLNPELIPSHYGLLLKAEEGEGAGQSYRYFEWRSRPLHEDPPTAKTLYWIEKELPSPGVSLRSIRLKQSLEDPGTPADSLLLVSVPPFGRLHVAPGQGQLESDSPGDLDLPQALEDSLSIAYAELDFSYDDEPLSLRTLRLGADKTLIIE